MMRKFLLTLVAFKGLTLFGQQHQIGLTLNYEKPAFSMTQSGLPLVLKVNASVSPGILYSISGKDGIHYHFSLRFLKIRTESGILVEKDEIDPLITSEFHARSLVGNCGVAYDFVKWKSNRIQILAGGSFYLNMTDYSDSTLYVNSITGTQVLYTSTFPTQFLFGGYFGLTYRRTVSNKLSVSTGIQFNTAYNHPLYREEYLAYYTNETIKQSQFFIMGNSIAANIMFLYKIGKH